MQFFATAKSIRMSPRKVRIVADAVKKLKLEVACEKLKFLSKTAAEPIYKALRSAIANATQGGKVQESDLKIENILIDEGTRMRRRDTSHRASRDSGTIHKRTSHIKIVLTDGK